MINLTDIPKELRKEGQWVSWRKEKGKDGRLTKVPYDPNRSRRAKIRFQRAEVGILQSISAYFKPNI